MTHKAIIPAGSAPPLAPYSPGVKTGGTVYVSGILAMDSDGIVVGLDNIKAQTKHVIESIQSVVEEAGGSLSDVAFNQIFLSDLNHYAEMNEVYGKFFGENPPARYCIKAELVRPEFLVEISSIAHVS